MTIVAFDSASNAVGPSVGATFTTIPTVSFAGWRSENSDRTAQLTDNPPYAPDVEPVYIRLDGPNQWHGRGIRPSVRSATVELLPS